MRTRILFVTISVLIITLAVYASIENGSFENGNDPSATLTLSSTDPAAIPGWLVVSGSVDYVGTYWKAQDGVRSIDLSGTDAGRIKQTIPTIEEFTYQVNFYMSGNPEGPPAVKRLWVKATGTYELSYEFNTEKAGNTTADMKWTPFSYVFTAVTPKTNLEFFSDPGSQYGPALDNVTISAWVCHQDTDKAKAKTMLVPDNALAAHVSHGDGPGPCTD